MFQLPSLRGLFRRKAPKRGQPGRVRPALVELEDRCLPAVTLYPVAGLGPGLPNASLAEIARGPDGNLWFTEPASNRIGRITPAGVVTEFTVPTANTLPGGITAGPDGNLWFTEDFSEGRGQKIGRISPSGAITEFPLPAGDAPAHITAGPDGNLWFTLMNDGAAKIGRILPTGQLTEFALSRFDAAGGITVGPDGNLWFATQAGQGIGRITPAGAITEFQIPTGPHTSPFSNLFYPLGITAGPDGNLWFAESVGHAVGRLSTTGTFTIFPASAGGSPLFITAGPDGNLWFTTGGSSLGRITPAGVITGFSLPDAGAGLTVGPDGNLWIAGSTGIMRFTLGGTRAAATTTTLTASANPVALGQRLALTVTVTPAFAGAGSPTGTIVLRDGNTILGVANLDSFGKAVFTFIPGQVIRTGRRRAAIPPRGIHRLGASTVLPRGIHHLTASYEGDGNFAFSVSARLDLTVL
jgi:streptogramin lyase